MNQDETDFQMVDYSALREAVSAAESMQSRVVQLTTVGLAILVSFAETRGDAAVGAVLNAVVPLAAFAGLILALEQLERTVYVGSLGENLARKIKSQFEGSEATYPDSWPSDRSVAVRRFAGVFLIVLGFQIVGTVLAFVDASLVDAPITWVAPAFAVLTSISTAVYVWRRYSTDLRSL